MWNNGEFNRNLYTGWDRRAGAYGPSSMDANPRWTITYAQYAQSRMVKDQEGANEFITGDGKGITTHRDPNYPNFIRTDYTALDNNYLTFQNELTWSVQDRIDYFLEQNLLNLDPNLVVIQLENSDNNLNLSDHIYRSFIEYFWDRQINQQTIDMHAVKVRNFFRSRQYRLQGLFEALMQRQLNNTSTTSGSNATNYTDETLSRGAISTVPENEVNVDVEDTNLTYADSFNKSKTTKTHTVDGDTSQVRTSSEDMNLWRYVNMESELDWLFREVIREELFM